jgi:hypothetical protein
MHERQRKLTRFNHRLQPRAAGAMMGRSAEATRQTDTSNDLSEVQVDQSALNWSM